MPKVNLKEAKHFTHRKLVQTIARENLISEATVKKVLEALVNVTVQHVAQGEVVEIHGLGLMWMSEKTVTCHWLPDDHPDKERTTSTPRFQVARSYKQKMQVLAGCKPQYSPKPVDLSGIIHPSITIISAWEGTGKKPQYGRRKKRMKE